MCGLVRSAHCVNGNPAASNMSYAWLIICFVPTARNLEVWGTHP